MRIVFIQMFLGFRAKTGRDKITRKWRREENEQRGAHQRQAQFVSHLRYILYIHLFLYYYEDNVQVKLKLKLAPIFLPLRVYTKAFY